MRDRRLDLAPVPLVEVLHAVFHRRLVRPDLAAALREERLAAGVHALGDLVVFLRRFAVRRLLGVDELALFEREFVDAEQAAYRETAKEDDEIAERMDAGRKALFAQGRSEVGPYQSPMEDGMQHFHEWYRREIEASVAHL